MSSFAAQQPDRTEADVAPAEAADIADAASVESTQRDGREAAAHTWTESGLAGGTGTVSDPDVMGDSRVVGNPGGVGGPGVAGDLGVVGDSADRGVSDEASDLGDPGDLGVLDRLADRELAEHPDVYERIHAQLRGALADIDDA